MKILGYEAWCMVVIKWNALAFHFIIMEAEEKYTWYEITKAETSDQRMLRKSHLINEQKIPKPRNRQI